MLSYQVPSTPASLMIAVYRKIFPTVKKELTYWQKRANEIPDKELRSQALASITAKRFHCQGGAVYALLAGDRWKKCVRFIVAYQTISDYLDNLCDRSTTMEAKSFELLHTAMIDALSGKVESTDYYEFFPHKQDNGYLLELVKTCKEVVVLLDDIPTFQDQALWLAELYRDLQVHKHVIPEERVPRLTTWSRENNIYPLQWYEFSAAAGSTLGIYCLISYGLAGRLYRKFANQIVTSYFPYVQGLHILLDYYIDQQEDVIEKDLNFCSYYADQSTKHERLHYFYKQANLYTESLPNYYFHQMVIQGLIGLYLGDEKVKQLNDSRAVKRMFFKKGGRAALFFHWNTRVYYFMKRFFHQKTAHTHK